MMAAEEELYVYTQCTAHTEVHAHTRAAHRTHAVHAHTHMKRTAHMEVHAHTHAVHRTRTHTRSASKTRSTYIFMIHTQCIIHSTSQQQSTRVRIAIPVFAGASCDAHPYVHVHAHGRITRMRTVIIMGTHVHKHAHGNIHAKPNRPCHAAVDDTCTDARVADHVIRTHYY